MTHKEKAIELQDTIRYLYEKEGRDKAYIARLLKIDYKILCSYVKEQGYVKANIRHMNPSNQKFANKHQQYIKSQLDKNNSITNIAKELGVTKDYLFYIVSRVEVLNKASQDRAVRIKQQKIDKEQRHKEKILEGYGWYDIPDEKWSKILGYEDYEVSDFGRIRKFDEKYNSYRIICQTPNVRNNRLYVMLYNNEKRANLQVARLVGFAFVDGHSKEKNTINHKDTNVQNNKADNLEWVTQEDNNIHSYNNGRNKAYAYTKHKKFKKIILNGEYEFKTIRACGKFLGVSETQMHRYIDKECFSEKIKSIEFVY